MRAGLSHGVLGVLLAAAVAFHAGRTQAGPPARHALSFRILHVMSYHSPWRWTDGQLEGFKEGLVNGYDWDQK